MEAPGRLADWWCSLYTLFLSVSDLYLRPFSAGIRALPTGISSVLVHNSIIVPICNTEPILQSFGGMKRVFIQIVFSSIAAGLLACAG